ncbi:hypothetical protein QYF61_002754 [Mycteria americana]|uniref:Uncharacterized protein n=1 Tax=Mycteria americana TaxID=33587 RepID=A0AAN7NVP3_MYCAM|nr:hypothetical protein QYF61_002754 [Mycteria americana]
MKGKKVSLINLIAFYSEKTGSVNEVRAVNVTYLDLSEAFSTASHHSLTDKLMRYWLHKWTSGLKLSCANLEKIQRSFNSAWRPLLLPGLDAGRAASTALGRTNPLHLPRPGLSDPGTARCLATSPTQAAHGLGKLREMQRSYDQQQNCSNDQSFYHNEIQLTQVMSSFIHLQQGSEEHRRKCAIIGNFSH